jgi:hypothetical protein
MKKKRTGAFYVSAHSRIYICVCFKVRLHSYTRLTKKNKRKEQTFDENDEEKRNKTTNEMNEINCVFIYLLSRVG